MKRLKILAVLLALSITGVAAQTADPGARKLPPLEKKPLNLEYLGKSSASVLKRIDKHNADADHKPKSGSKGAAKPLREVAAAMPIARPDTTVTFYLLTQKPDSTVFYHIRIKQPR